MSHDQTQEPTRTFNMELEPVIFWPRRPRRYAATSSTDRTHALHPSSGNLQKRAITWVQLSNSAHPEGYLALPSGGCGSGPVSTDWSLGQRGGDGIEGSVGAVSPRQKRVSRGPQRLPDFFATPRLQKCKSAVSSQSSSPFQTTCHSKYYQISHTAGNGSYSIPRDQSSPHPSRKSFVLPLRHYARISAIDVCHRIYCRGVTLMERHTLTGLSWISFGSSINGL